MFSQLFCAIMLMSTPANEFSLNTAVNPVRAQQQVLLGSATVDIRATDGSITGNVYMRLSLLDNITLAETLVDGRPGSPTATAQPIHLPLLYRQGFFDPELELVAAADTISIIRWIQGERYIWVRVKMPGITADDAWLRDVASDTLVLPGYGRMPEFTFGLAAEQSYADSQPEYEEAIRKANLPGCSRSMEPQSTDDIVSTLFLADTTGANLGNGQTLVLLAETFVDTPETGATGVIEAASSDDINVGTSQQFFVRKDDSAARIAKDLVSLEGSAQQTDTPLCSDLPGNPTGLVGHRTQIDIVANMLPTTSTWRADPRMSFGLQVPASSSFGFLIDNNDPLGTLPNGNPYYASAYLSHEGIQPFVVVGGTEAFSLGGHTLSRMAYMLYPQDPQISRPWDDFMTHALLDVTLFADENGAATPVELTIQLMEGDYNLFPNHSFQLPTQQARLPWTQYAQTTVSLGNFQTCSDLLSANYFPDAAMLAALQTLFPSGLTAAEAATVTNLDLSGQGISDLTGLHLFSQLQVLNVSNNQITTLDLYHNAALIDIDAADNQIVDTRPLVRQDMGIFANHRLILDRNPLWEGDCYYMLLLDERAALSGATISYADLNGGLNCEQELPFVASYDLDANGIFTLAEAGSVTELRYSNLDWEQAADWPNVTYVHANNTTATEIDLGQWSRLRYFYHLNGSIDTLSMGDNPHLTYVHVFNSNLSQFNSGHAPKLRSLNLRYNDLTNINVDGFPLLQGLHLADNQLLSFDAALPELSALDLIGNDVGSVDFTAYPNLRYLTYNQHYDAAQTPFLEELSLGTGNLVDLSQLPRLNTLGITTDAPISLDLQAYPQIQTLYFGGVGNQTFDQIPHLRYLSVGGTFDHLQIRNTQVLGSFFLGFMDIETLTLDNVDGLDALYFEQSYLVSRINRLNLLNMPRISRLNSNIELNELVIDNAPLFRNLRVADTTLDLFQVDIPGLQELDMERVTMDALDMSGIAELRQVYIRGGTIPHIDLSNNPVLENSATNSAGIETLALFNNPSLRGVEAEANQLTALDLSGSDSVEYLFAFNNQLESMVLPPAIQTAELAYNRIASLTVDPSAPLSRLDISYNFVDDLTSLSANTFVGSQANHSIDLSRNVLECDDVATLENRTQQSSASFYYTRQGDQGELFPELPTWESESIDIRNLIPHVSGYLPYVLDCE